MLGCEKPAEQTPEASGPVSRVALAGTLQAASRPVSGTVEILQEGSKYTLRLRKVRVKATGPIHVYLVAHPAASTTRDVLATEDRYDFGPLDEQADDQYIPLPSEPAAALRSVVLFQPTFGVNLAWAKLDVP